MHRALTGLLVSLALTAAVTLLAPARAVACSCMMLTEAEALAMADLAFVGVVAEVRDERAGQPMMGGGDEIVFTFAVEQLIKGEAAPAGRVRISSARDGAACGAGFGVAQRWRVYASVGQGAYASSLCSGNELLAERVPIPAVQADDGSGTIPIELVVAGAGLAVLVAGSALAFSRRGGGASAPS